jgi:ZIP family zinc transporter
MAALTLGWGLVAGSAAFLGALLGWFARPSPRMIGLLMAFASGILLAVAAFELFDEAFAYGGFPPAAFGLLAGGALFATGLAWLDRRGAGKRKLSAIHTIEAREPASVVAMATILDGIPEALIIGVGFYTGEGVGIATVIAVFLSNVPESLATTARMRAIGRSAGYVAAVWLAVALATGIAAFLGYALLGDVRPAGKAFVQALAGGAFLVFIVNSMIPAAFSETRNLAGFVVVIGFLAGYALSRFVG